MSGESLSNEVHALVRVSAALASGSREALEEELELAVHAARAARVEEILLQSYLFLGYPAALNALDSWRQVSGSPPPQPTRDDWRGWAERGQEVCQRVYSSQYERLRENVKKLHPDMERWMVVEGYGKVLGRPGLDLRTRELAVVAVLAVIGADRQLYSHLRGALACGASPEEVEATLEAAEPYLRGPARLRARTTWERLLSSGPARTADADVQARGPETVDAPNAERE